MTEREKRQRAEQRLHIRQTIGWIGWIVVLFYCGVPMLICQLTLGFVDFPRLEWLLSWVIAFWIYYVFVAWCDHSK